MLIDDLLAVVRKVQASQLPASGTESFNPDEGPETSIIGRTPKMLEVYRAIARVAPTDVSVLILGPADQEKNLWPAPFTTTARGPKCRLFP